MACKKIKRPIYKICIGDLDEEIKIQVKTKLPKNDGSIEADLDITDFETVWAAHDEIKGHRSFDGVSLNDQPAIVDRFVIRDLEGIDQKNIIEKNGEKYIIGSILKLRKSEFMIIYASKSGSSEIKANYLI